MKKTNLALLGAVIIILFAALLLDYLITDEQIELLKIMGLTCVVTALLSFAISELSKTYSQVDKLWSIIPIAYIWIMAYMADWQPRALLMAGVATIWGIRLNYNFHRRGGTLKFWEGEEHYSWEVLRKNPLLHMEVTKFER
jgi:steroid 5-alpha reductase family enzyme